MPYINSVTSAIDAANLFDTFPEYYPDLIAYAKTTFECDASCLDCTGPTAYDCLSCTDDSLEVNAQNGNYTCGAVELGMIALMALLMI